MVTKAAVMTLKRYKTQKSDHGQAMAAIVFYIKVYLDKGF